MGENSNDDDSAKVVDMKTARERLEPERKERAAKALRKQFQTAMGWKTAVKPKKPASRGPTPSGKGPKGGRGKKK